MKPFRTPRVFREAAKDFAGPSQGSETTFELLEAWVYS